MMRSRVCYLVLMVIGLGSLAGAAFLYLGFWQETPGLVVDQPHQVVHDLLPGTSRDVEFCIRNRTGHPRRIVGENHV